LRYDLKYWNHKSVRDPLYGFIQLSKREAQLTGTPFMHRLTRIKQLAHTYLVYPSAVHTRFEHSLGALHMADRLCNCFKIEGRRKEIIRCAVLLHDVGHGPFSHLFENIMVKINGLDFTHEDVTRAIIEHDDTIRMILQGNINSSDNFLDIHSEVISFFTKKGIESRDVDPLGKSILSGTIDADKLDYLRRDSYHTGASYGVFDLERLLATLTSIKDNNKQYPVILKKGTPVYESFKLARYLMYVQVYQHHTRLIADRMFLRSLELGIFKEKSISTRLFQFYGKEKSFLKEYFKMDDHSIYELVLAKSDKSGHSFKIMNDLKNRRLFKRGYDIAFADISNGIIRMNIQKMDPQKLEQDISERAVVPVDLVIVHKESDEGGKKSYRTFGRITDSGEIPLMFLDEKGHPHPYDEISPIVMRNEPSQVLYVFTNAKYRSQVSAACRQILR
jgi:uncharacterized protein